MGCASSKDDINDQLANFFQVMNVDEEFQPISPGQIEITDTELVFHQRGKLPTKWTLKNLRKYGYDSEIFSFECGRRSATGEGVFAFQCRRAEQLFTLLQHNIQIRNRSEEVALPLTEMPLNGPTSQRRSAPESYLNPVCSTRPTLSRPGSITSNGPMSPTAISSPLEDNNNKRGSAIERSYINSEVIPEVVACPQYINVPNMGALPDPIDEYSQTSHLYVNVERISETSKSSDTKDPELSRLKLTLPPVEEGPCYVNVNRYSHVGSEGIPDCSSQENESVPVTPTAMAVNYAELDLPSNKMANGAAQQSPPPESPVKIKSYVTIDFNKTNALSVIIDDIEEGSRKTRHNAAIGDVLRHSNSVSD